MIAKRVLVGMDKKMDWDFDVFAAKIPVSHSSWKMVLVEVSDYLLGLPIETKWSYALHVALGAADTGAGHPVRAEVANAIPK